MDFGPDPVQPTFGTGDGGIGDNSGGLSITLYQLEAVLTAVESSTSGRVKALYRTRL